MSKKIPAEEFYGSIKEIYRAYSDDVMKEVNESVKEVAEDSKGELKVAGSFQNRSGEYRKGWKITFKELRYGLTAVVHNKVYQLTHLLESGHAKFLWGRATGEEVRAFPHIEKVNEEAQKKLEDEIRRRIGDL